MDCLSGSLTGEGPAGLAGTDQMSVYTETSRQNR